MAFLLPVVISKDPRGVRGRERLDRAERHAARQVLHRLRRQQADRCAHEAGDLGVVTAGVDGSRRGARVGMAGDGERIERRDDRLGVALDRLVDALLQLVARHPGGTS